MPFEPETYYLLPFNPKNWAATAGVMNFCEKHQCFWILDCISSYVPQISKRRPDYLLIIEVRVAGSEAMFRISDEVNGELITQKIQYTDLKEDVEFWAINDSPVSFDPTFNTTVLLCPRNVMTSLHVRLLIVRAACRGLCLHCIGLPTLEPM